MKHRSLVFSNQEKKFLSLLDAVPVPTVLSLLQIKGNRLTAPTGLNSLSAGVINKVLASAAASFKLTDEEKRFAINVPVMMGVSTKKRLNGLLTSLDKSMTTHPSIILTPAFGFPPFTAFKFLKGHQDASLDELDSLAFQFEKRLPLALQRFEGLALDTIITGLLRLSYVAFLGQLFVTISLHFVAVKTGGVFSFAPRVAGEPFLQNSKSLLNLTKQALSSLSQLWASKHAVNIVRGNHPPLVACPKKERDDLLIVESEWFAKNTLAICDKFKLQNCQSDGCVFCASMPLVSTLVGANLVAYTFLMLHSVLTLTWAKTGPLHLCTKTSKTAATRGQSTVISAKGQQEPFKTVRVRVRGREAALREGAEGDGAP